MDIKIDGTRSVRLARVCDLVGVSRATVWRLLKQDPSFPRPFHPTPAVTAWCETELLGWIESKKATRDGR